jgi:hypothetical protein
MFSALWNPKVTDSETVSVALAGPLPTACDWWDPRSVSHPDLCSPFILSRLNTLEVDSASVKAAECASVGETSCILSGEIGFGVPAAFLYSPEEGIRAVIAPRLIPFESEVRTVRAQDPAALYRSDVFRWNHSVKVEYMRAGSKSVVTELIHGTDAYCVQSLRQSIAGECWERLDG